MNASGTTLPFGPNRANVRSGSPIAVQGIEKTSIQCPMFARFGEPSSLVSSERPLTGIYFDSAIIGRSFGRTVSGINSFK